VVLTCLCAASAKMPDSGGGQGLDPSNGADFGLVSACLPGAARSWTGLPGHRTGRQIRVDKGMQGVKRPLPGRPVEKLGPIGEKGMYIFLKNIYTLGLYVK
jgi:hypothetical protein